jgi:hypothetical protein
MRRSRDVRPGFLRCGYIGVRADGWRLSSGDDAGLSSTAAAGNDDYGCESYRQELAADASGEWGCCRVGNSLPCSGAE